MQKPSYTLNNFVRLPLTVFLFRSVLLEYRFLKNLNYISDQQDSNVSVEKARTENRIGSIQSGVRREVRSISASR